MGPVQITGVTAQDQTTRQTLPVLVDTSGRLLTVGAAGEAHLGEVGGIANVIDITPAVSTSPAYTAGDAVGGKQTLASALRVASGTALLESISITDLGNQKAALEIIIFDSDPAAATITDNAAFAWSTDITKVLGHITVAAADYVTIAGEAVATLSGLNIVLKGAATTLYAAVVAVGTPTYTATTDLKFRYGILQN